MVTVLASDKSQSERVDTSVPVEVSVVIPCLNEANSLAFCIDKAVTAFRGAGLSGEVIVADNGSTDGSIQIAEEHGARVVRVEERGYGIALRAGIAAARGPFIVMGDADDSYDFGEVRKFPSRCGRTSGDGPRTCAVFGTAGGTCGSCCCMRRIGSFCCRAERCWRPACSLSSGCCPDRARFRLASFWTSTP